MSAARLKHLHQVKNLVDRKSGSNEKLVIQKSQLDERLARRKISQAKDRSSENWSSEKLVERKLVKRKLVKRKLVKRKLVKRKTRWRASMRASITRFRLHRRRWAR